MNLALPQESMQSGLADFVGQGVGLGCECGRCKTCFKSQISLKHSRYDKTILENDKDIAFAVSIGMRSDC